MRITKIVPYGVIAWILLWAIISCCSCSTKHLTKSNTSVKTDSTSVVKSDSVVTAKSDSLSLKVTEEDESESVTVELETSGVTAQDYDTQIGSTPPKMPLNAPVDNQRSTLLSTNKKPYKYKVNGYDIETTLPAKIITVKTGKQTKKIDLAQVSDINSADVKKDIKTEVKKVEKVKDKQVKRSGLPFGFWMWGGIGILLLATYVWIGGRFETVRGWLKRKNSDHA